MKQNSWLGSIISKIPENLIITCDEKGYGVGGN